ncbi:hypothetical protein TNCT_192281 [Trichonephila clavata]|uniref:Uncharacterized protein n=1 Tax=Trichonephila clavata TaxID=2740835 RepID=A0A8X6L885_TRICU|nr:hypothetical protein TNCT_192281 [Trichonephila clavata]
MATLRFIRKNKKNPIQSQNPACLEGGYVLGPLYSLLDGLSFLSNLFLYCFLCLFRIVVLQNLLLSGDSMPLFYQSILQRSFVCTKNSLILASPFLFCATYFGVSKKRKEQYQSQRF